LPGNFGIRRFAARALQPEAKAPEEQTAVLAPVILGEGFFYAAQIYSAATGGTHKKEMAF